MKSTSLAIFFVMPGSSPGMTVRCAGAFVMLLLSLTK
jgi:hypothetical protein